MGQVLNYEPLPGKRSSNKITQAPTSDPMLCSIPCLPLHAPSHLSARSGSCLVVVVLAFELPKKGRTGQQPGSRTSKTSFMLFISCCCCCSIQQPLHFKTRQKEEKAMLWTTMVDRVALRCGNMLAGPHAAQAQEKCVLFLFHVSFYHIK